MVTSLLQSIPWFHDGDSLAQSPVPEFLLCSELTTKNALSFPANLCRFRQSFVVSGKALSFPAKLCRFRQSFVIFR
jgi:hypothetical protein